MKENLRRWKWRRKLQESRVKHTEWKMKQLAKMPLPMRRTYREKWFGKRKGGEKS
jgi:hypothetical protein